MKQIKKIRTSELDEHNKAVAVAQKNTCWNIPRKYIISYKSQLKILWDNLILLSAVYVSMVFPFSFAFDTYYQSRRVDGVQLIFDILFILDIILMFFTSTITKKGQETYDPIIIRNEYLKTQRFLFDLGSILGIQLFTQYNRIFQFCGFFKMTRIFRIQKMIANSSFNNDMKAVLQFLKIIMYFVVFIHFMACMWWWVIVQEGSPTRFGLDLEYEVYKSHFNQTYYDADGQLVPINESIVFQWGPIKTFNSDTWLRSPTDPDFNVYWETQSKQWYQPSSWVNFLDQKNFSIERTIIENYLEMLYYGLLILFQNEMGPVN